MADMRKKDCGLHRHTDNPEEKSATPLTSVHIRPNAAIFKLLHLYRPSAYLERVTYSFAIFSIRRIVEDNMPRASL